MTLTMTPAEREARIVRCLTDMAPNFYPWPGDAARYVIETCFPDATPAEWDFAAGYVRDHPEIRDGERLPVSRVLARYREQAEELWRQAGAAAMGERWDEAIALLREAFLLNPVEAEFWGRYMAIVETKRAGGAA